MSSSPSVLSDRDPNIAQSPDKKHNMKDNGKTQDPPMSLEYHRQVLESRLKENKSVTHSSNQPADTSFQSAAEAHMYSLRSSNQQTYVSPSDNLMSPATAKLAAFKNKHVKR